MTLPLRRRSLLLSLTGVMAGSRAASADASFGPEAPVSEPTDYRQSDYRAPTPATLHGALVLTTPQAHLLWLGKKKPVFVDVLPQPPRPQGLPADTIWRPQPRFDIPGSLWLPDTGYGTLPPAMQAYLVANLRRARAAVPGRLLVFYCLADCWMSWNAARRAVALGLAPVAWLPGGTTGWEAAGYPVQLRWPEARPEPAAP